MFAWQLPLERVSHIPCPHIQAEEAHEEVDHKHIAELLRESQQIRSNSGVGSPEVGHHVTFTVLCALDRSLTFCCCDSVFFLHRGVFGGVIIAWPHTCPACVLRTYVLYTGRQVCGRPSTCTAEQCSQISCAPFPGGAAVQSPPCAVLERPLRAPASYCPAEVCAEALCWRSQHSDFPCWALQVT